MAPLADPIEVELAEKAARKQAQGQARQAEEGELIR